MLMEDDDPTPIYAQKLHEMLLEFSIITQRFWKHNTKDLTFGQGPGCSSVGEGAFVEHGPFKPKGDGLLKNDYSWNKAGDNLVFLEKWFHKYPQYKNRDFYITGESYAGHYVPQLATLIVHSKAKINLKGIAIGNPLLDFENDFNSRGEYLWSHGLISDDTYDMCNNVCNHSTLRRQSNSDAITPACSLVSTQASKEIGEFVNDYDVTLNVCLSDVFSQSQVLDPNPKIDVCVENETSIYLNRKDVQTALNARLVNVNEWEVCSSILEYAMSDMEEAMTPVLASLIKSGIRVFIYSGDQDSVLPLTGTRMVVNRLAKRLGLTTTLPYRAWINDNQVGGWAQVYGDSVLSYATIRGAAHEAPFTQPQRSIALFKCFLAGKPLPRAKDETDPNNH
ncbi:hypothetical protein QVD17_17796 [Tagetes erecta]|uniref:Carboxypeptidase n=1 Tax=Tagetes erecta TaxID=13708 RepID=A0AAD8NUN4_TARER|nr:hypothetical protein QVD17_17796 [Tagetes erecta]